MNCFLGRKGYTLIKSHFDNETLDNLKLDLIAKPINMMQQQSKKYESNKKKNTYLSLLQTLNDPQNKTFPVYRESTKRLYIPRFFGVKKFGDCSPLNLNISHDIDLSFNGVLRDNQVIVVEKYMQNLSKGGGILELDCAYGKTVIALNIISLVKKRLL